MKKLRSLVFILLVPTVAIGEDDSVIPTGTPMSDKEIREKLLELEKKQEGYVQIPPVDGRRELSKVSGVGREPSLQLLKAMGNTTAEEIEGYCREVIVTDNLQPIIMLLRDPSDIVAQGAALALRKVKTKQVAEGFLRAWPHLKDEVIGGTEGQIMRREYRKVFINCLSEITGQGLKKDAPNEEKMKLLSTAVERMKADTK